MGGFAGTVDLLNAVIVPTAALTVGTAFVPPMVPLWSVISALLQSRTAAHPLQGAH
jgi:hypothetical protein